MKNKTYARMILMSALAVLALAVTGCGDGGQTVTRDNPTIPQESNPLVGMWKGVDLVDPQLVVDVFFDDTIMSAWSYHDPDDLVDGWVVGPTDDRCAHCSYRNLDDEIYCWELRKTTDQRPWYERVEYRILPDNKLRLIGLTNPEHLAYPMWPEDGEHVTSYFFTGDTLVINSFVPGDYITNPYPLHLSVIHLLRSKNHEK